MRKWFGCVLILIFSFNVYSADSAGEEKFWIFYGDTDGYNPDLKLNGQAGEMLPVVIRVSTDGVVVSDTDVSFTVTPGSSNLQFFASVTDTIPSTIFKTTHGQAKIWVKGTGIVSNGNVTVTGEGIGSGYRENIYFTVSIYSVDYANYYSTNGYGKVDSVEIYFKREITEAMIPDSVALWWPDMTNSKVIKGKMLWVLSFDKKHISIKLPEPFPEAITTYGSSRRLVTTYWNDPLAPYIPTQMIGINVNDKIGPLLMSAVLIERPSYNSTGYDSIKITLSEAVQMDPINTLKGYSLTLKKLGGGSFQLNILQADQIGDTITLVVENVGINSPKAVDSLQITSTGPTADLYGNHANIDNRPVALALKEIPAEIDTACYYYDDDGNGVVDKATIKFMKNVKIDSISMNFNFGYIQTGVIQRTKLKYSTDSSTIEVNLEGSFQDLNKTNGFMAVAVTYLDFQGLPTKIGIVKDKTTPVIMSAQYNPGSEISGGMSYDTLFLKFSEHVQMLLNTFDGRSLVLRKWDETTLSQSVIVDAKTIQDSTGIMFIVSAHGVDSSIFKDSLKIYVSGPTAIADMSGNAACSIYSRPTLIRYLKHRPEHPDIDTNSTNDTNKSNGCGCGAGAGLAFIPPLFYRFRGRIKRSRKHW